jgi:pSer/pThr/pTyr-binding forkhead associated (FHA) protein
MTIRCSNCQNLEIEGALICSECGEKLIKQDGLTTAAIPDTRPGEDEAIEAPTPPPPAIATEAFVSLHILRTGQILPLVGSEEYTIGRISEGQSIVPDIDLTPYGAYRKGVSRLHASIKTEKDAVTISDLGSSNGTRVNNVPISAHKDEPLKHGDVLALGKFKLQTLIRQE